MEKALGALHARPGVTSVPWDGFGPPDAFAAAEVGVSPMPKLLGGDAAEVQVLGVGPHDDEEQPHDVSPSWVV